MNCILAIGPNPSSALLFWNLVLSSSLPHQTVCSTAPSSSSSAHHTVLDNPGTLSYVYRPISINLWSQPGISQDYLDLCFLFLPAAECVSLFLWVLNSANPAGSSAPRCDYWRDSARTPSPVLFYSHLNNLCSNSHSVQAACRSRSNSVASCCVEFPDLPPYSWDHLSIWVSHLL